MEKLSIFCLGLLAGTLLMAFITAGKLAISKKHYDEVVKAVMVQIYQDEPNYYLDVLVETDAFYELNQYVDLSDY